MKQVTDELLEAGIITLSDSEYCSPFFIKRKPDGGYRPLIDFKELNKITERIHWPFPRIRDLLFRLAKSIQFSKADAKCGFFQFIIAKECRKYTAFSDGTRKLEYARVPQGATNSPLFFMQVITMALGDLSFVIIYINDFFIHSESA